MVNEMKWVIPVGAKKGAYSKLIPHYKKIVDHYLEVSCNKGNLQETTLQRNEVTLAKFLFYLQTADITNLSEVTEDDVVRYFWKDGRTRLCASLRYILRCTLLDISDEYPECESIAAWIPMIRVTRKNIQYLTDEEAEAVREVCTSENSGLSYRDKAVGMILLRTGIRACDIAGLTMDSIDWDKDMICLVQQKTSIPLKLPLLPTVGNAIYDYLKNEREYDGNELFITAKGKPFKSSDVSRCTNRIFDAAGIRTNPGDRRGSHIFRHRVAKKLLENDTPQPVISSILGHTDPVSVETYLSTDIKHLRECALSVEKYMLDWEVFDNA